jgi:ribosomal protein S18 acetylase RimI-like enzyme
VDLPNGYSLRRAAPGDVAEIVAIERAQMRPLYERASPGSWNEDEAAALLLANLDRALVVEHDGSLVACAYGWIEDEATEVLHSLQVVSGHRDRGIGAWLVRRVEERAREEGREAVGLAVHEGNPAIRLYERLGYEVAGEDGPSTLAMVKRLD